MTAEKALQEYFNKYKYNFVVQKFIDYPCQWINYGTKEYDEFIKNNGFVNHREVFKDEIVIDIDMDKDLPLVLSQAESKLMAQTIKKRFDSESISTSGFPSGGSGFHIHAFFPELAQMSGFDANIMKKIIINHYCKGFLYKNKGNKGKVQTQGLPTIQLEYAKHRKGGVKEPLWIGGNENKIPSHLWVEFKNKKQNDIEWIEKFKKNLDDKKPKAIEFLESKEFATHKDGRKRAMFVLTAYYKQFYDNDDVFSIIKKWSDEMNFGFNDKTIKSTIKSSKGCYPANYLNDMFDDIGVNKEGIYEEA